MDTGKSHKKDIEWESLLNKDELALGKKIQSLIDTKQPLQWERAGNEKQIILDSEKDPYLGCYSADPKANVTILTDGKHTKKASFSLTSGDMQNFQVSNYNYIIIRHHFPGKNGKEVRYQSVIFKNKNLKYYVKHLLKLSFIQFYLVQVEVLIIQH